MKNIRRIFTIILAIELLVLGFQQVKTEPVKIVRAIGSIIVTFPSVPLFSETGWTPGQSVTRSFQIENSGLFGQNVAIKAENIIDESDPPLADAISIVISVNGSPVFGSGSSTGFMLLSDFYNQTQVNLAALGAGAIIPVDIALELDPGAGAEFQNLSTHFDITVLAEQISNALPTLPPLPTLQPLAPLGGLPKLPGLQPLNIL